MTELEATLITAALDRHDREIAELRDQVAALSALVTEMLDDEHPAGKPGS